MLACLSLGWFNDDRRGMEPGPSWYIILINLQGTVDSIVLRQSATVRVQCDPVAAAPMWWDSTGLTSCLLQVMLVHASEWLQAFPASPACLGRLRKTHLSELMSAPPSAYWLSCVAGVLLVYQHDTTE